MKLNVNSSMITLKCVLFLFFGAIGSIFPFLPLHMDNTIGLSKDESVIVSIISPLIALLGPLVAAPLADRLAGGSPRSKTGYYLRFMITICLVLSTIFYWLLLTIPPIIRNPPHVTFTCDREEGFILQERCAADQSCYDWGSGKGSVLVKNCKYACNDSSAYIVESTTMYPDEDGGYDSEDSFFDDVNYGSGLEPVEPVEPVPVLSNNDYVQQSVNQFHLYIPPPHMCYVNVSGDTVCEVYTAQSRPIKFVIGLSPSIATEEDGENHCKYRITDSFMCRIPDAVMENLTTHQEDCHPNVLCELHEPYTHRNSMLKPSQCITENISFWLYLFIRSIADIFVAAAATLLATAVVIATRETSTGRADVGKQFAAGALGFGIFAPIIGGVAGLEKGNKYMFLDISLICYTVLMLIAAVILLVDRKMPLSPPEWWWHTRCGFLALPMSSVRKYGMEIGALGIALFLLGVFWNAIDSFLPWHIVHIEERQYLVIGLTITVAAIPAVLFLIFAERIVDYCGHANILIFCFVSYICHHLALMSITEESYNILLCEWLEMFTLHIMYVTAVLYLRHLVPRKFTACGQALPIIAHFCLGRCFGALFGGMAYTEYPNDFSYVHRGFAVAAAVVATVYFIVYHFFMKPRYAAPMHLPPDPAPAVVQSMNGNGSYTPLRVYHNCKSKKGQFRY